jgi:hypothetical protein
MSPRRRQRVPWRRATPSAPSTPACPNPRAHPPDTPPVPAHPKLTRRAPARIRTETTPAQQPDPARTLGAPCAAHCCGRTPAATLLAGRVLDHSSLPVHAVRLARSRAACETSSLRKNTLHRVAMDGVHSTSPCATFGL